MYNHRIFSARLIAMIFCVTPGLSTAAIAADGSPSASGASLAFTSTEPVIVQARELMEAGEFSKAIKLLDSKKTSDARASDELREVMTRIRAAFSTDPDAMLAKVKKAIPDVTAEDIERWRKAGELQARTIDGQVWYFDREPANLFRFCDEAKSRRKATASRKDVWKLEDHIARVIAAAKDSSSPEVVPIRQRVTYRLTVPSSALGSNRARLCAFGCRSLRSIVSRRTSS